MRSLKSLTLEKVCEVLPEDIQDELVRKRLNEDYNPDSKKVRIIIEQKDPQGTTDCLKRMYELWKQVPQFIDYQSGVYSEFENDDVIRRAQDTGEETYYPRNIAWQKNIYLPKENITLCKWKPGHDLQLTKREWDEKLLQSITPEMEDNFVIVECNEYDTIVLCDYSITRIKKIVRVIPVYTIENTISVKDYIDNVPMFNYMQ